MKKKTMLAAGLGLAIMVGTGSATAQFSTYSIKMVNTLMTAKVSLFGNDNPNTDPHAFYGFGIQPGTLIYNVDATTSRHLFQAKTTPSGNPRILMELSGSGNVSIPSGSLTIDNNDINISRGQLSLNNPNNGGRVRLSTLATDFNGSLNFYSQSGARSFSFFTGEPLNSTQLLYLNSNGEVKIPVGPLTVSGGAISAKGVNVAYNSMLKFSNQSNLEASIGTATGSDMIYQAPGNHVFSVSVNNNTSSIVSQFTSNGSFFTGSVGVAVLNNTLPKTLSDGSSLSNYKLFVNGGILATEVRVRTGWADYVFEKGYRLEPLEDVEKQIGENGHLSGMPSSKEVSENGISIGEIAKLQQQKIEELTLYLIDMKKEIKKLQGALGPK